MKPKSFTVESSLKFFGLERGVSSGTMLQATFELEDGEDLQSSMIKAKESLDGLALKMEVANGGVTKDAFARISTGQREVYNRLLGRKTDVEPD